MSKKALKAAFPLTLPVMAGYIFLGIGFGVLLQSKGYNYIWALCMSITMYSGTMQYAAVDILANGTGLVSTAIMTFIIKARYLFYAISMLGRFKDKGFAKNILAYQLTDETYSILCTATPPDGVDETQFQLCISILNHLYWIVGGVCGAILGALLPFSFKGAEFSMTALFVIIFVEQWQSNKNHIPALTGLICSVICFMIFGKDSFVIPALLMIIAIIMVFSKDMEEKK